MANLEWQMAKEWIRSTGIVPMNGKAFEQSSDLIDFAQSLRDGVILCQVANQLKPYSIRDVSKVNNVNMHMFLCLRNIRAFLKACTDEFRLDAKLLFSANDLYDVSNFQAVIHTLSLLSQTYEAKTRSKLKPFPPENYQVQTKEEEEDIYGTLPDILDNKEPDYYKYDDEEENIYDHVQIDERIYDDIISMSKRKLKEQDAGSVKKPAVTDKRGHIINEIIETEENYLQALKVMSEDYIRPLKGHMSAEDKNMVFMNTEQIYILHTQFTRDLTTKKSSTNVKLNITAFVQYKDQFLIYALYCTGLSDAQQHAIELSRENGFRDKVEQCNKKADRKFPLQEQLVVPFQRILKYPLLLRDLNKQTPAGHDEKANVEKAFDVMDDIAKYINEYKRDADQVKLIAQIDNSVKFDIHGQGVKASQYGRHVKNGELQIRFDSNERKMAKRVAFLFEHAMLLCKSRGDLYDVKEVFDLQKFEIGTIPAVGKGKFSQGWSMQAHTNDGGKRYFTRRMTSKIRKKVLHKTLTSKIRKKVLHKTLTSKIRYKMYLIFDVNVMWMCEAKNCSMFAKTQQEKTIWAEEISKCIEAVTLTEWKGKLGNHQFELTTFESPQTCTVCNKYLRGQISQGYKCTTSGCCTIVHKQCFSQCPHCNPITSKPLKSTPTGRRVSRNNYEDSKLRSNVPQPNLPGRPISPQANNNNVDLSKYCWFAGVMSRDEASQRLSVCGDGAFLIRESPNQPGLAISIRYKTDVKHIKIGRNNDRYYLTDPKQFPSIADLVMYYKNNSLGSSFPSLPTKLTLGVNTSYDTNDSESQRTVKRVMTAKFNWQARNDKELSLVAGQQINVLHDGGNWWTGECNGKEGFFPNNYVE